MNRFLISIAPVSLLAILAADRLATLKLGSSQFAWGVWFEIRPLTRLASAPLAYVSSSIETQAFVLFLATIIVAALCRWLSFAVVASHAALFYVSATIIIAGVPSLISGEYFIPAHDGSLFVDMAWMQIAAFGAGLISCSYGHYVFLRGGTEPYERGNAAVGTAKPLSDA